jgi:hypothetical protein
VLNWRRDDSRLTQAESVIGLNQVLTNENRMSQSPGEMSNDYFSRGRTRDARAAAWASGVTPGGLGTGSFGPSPAPRSMRLTQAESVIGLNQVLTNENRMSQSPGEMSNDSVGPQQGPHHFAEGLIGPAVLNWRRDDSPDQQ